METTYTLTHAELVEIFKRWNTDHLNNYPDAKITNAEKQAPDQAKEFVRLLVEMRAK